LAAGKNRGVPVVNVMGSSAVVDQVPGVFPDDDDEMARL
jgi:hypothetical protein